MNGLAEIIKNDNFPFRRAERCLFDYPLYKGRLEALKDELSYLDKLSSVQVQNYDSIPNSSGQPADRVSARLEKINDVELEILRIECFTKPVERLLKDLSSDEYLGSAKKEMLAILKLRYLEGNTWQSVTEHLTIGKGTFNVRRKELVKLAINYFNLK